MGLDPIPVRGTDGLLHVAYELEVLNTSPREATITKVETLADATDGPAVGDISGPEVVARSMIVGDYTIPPEPVTTVPSGRTALLIIDDTYDEAGEPCRPRSSIVWRPLSGRCRPAKRSSPTTSRPGDPAHRREQVGEGRPVEIGPTGQLRQHQRVATM